MNLYIGRDFIMPHPKVWTMSNMGWDRFGPLYRRFQSLINAGVFEFEQRNDGSRKKHTAVQKLLNKYFGHQELTPLNLRSNFLSVAFIVYGVTVIVSLITLFSEFLHSILIACHNVQNKI